MMRIFTMICCALALTACDQTAEKQTTVKDNSATIASVTHYACGDKSDFSVRFMTEPNQAEVTMADGTAVLLPAEKTGNDFLYSSPHHKLSGTASTVTWTVDDKASVQCQAKN